MGGMTVLCVLLGATWLLLLVKHLRLDRRIRILADRLDGYNAGCTEMLDVALQEDTLARLQNGIGDLQHSHVRIKALHEEECRRTSALTADISHQLKTPLTTLRLYAELDGAAHMEASLEQIERMEILIQALLRLERLCADGYAFRFAYADAQLLLQEQWQSLQALWSRKTLMTEGNARILCDEKWLGEAFLNLLKNACEHTPEDGRIWVRMERTEAAFFCTLEDNGGGVSPEELPRLFQRFYRAKGSDKNGAGIGLAIVKEIVARHHGTVIAENGLHGLKITLSMPMLDRTLTES